MDECRHGLREEWCATCRKDIPVDQDSLAGLFTTTIARFEGRCSGGCERAIGVGETIYLVDGDWVNARCAMEAV